jgi:hypothetical protein
MREAGREGLGVHIFVTSIFNFRSEIFGIRAALLTAEAVCHRDRNSRSDPPAAVPLSLSNQWSGLYRSQETGL